MTKRWIKTISLLSTVALLAGCLSDLDSEVVESTIAPDQVVVETVTNQLSSDNYKAVITDGRYQLGVGASDNSNLSSAGNILAFEEGLLRISHATFPTDQYLLREGLIIDEETMSRWLARESTANPEGLNPALANNEAETNNDQTTGETSEETTTSAENTQVIVDTTSTPIYLSQVMEKNIMVETEDGYQLAGVMLGLAMNSVYQYTDEEGVSYQQEISLGEMRERGRSYANIIVGRLRNTEALRNVPIVVGLFRQAPNNEIAGGTYVMYGISREGNYIADWTELNEYRVSLPIISSANYAEQYEFFDNFSNQVSNFFPNLNGISGEALYVNNNLSSLTIEIVTQFYQQTEITALTQHVTDMAAVHLPTGIPIEISITSAHGPEAIISRQAGSENYFSHIYQQ